MDPVAAVIVGIGVVVLLVGLLGAMLPMLPGPPISALGSFIVQLGLTVDGEAAPVGWGICIISIVLGVFMTIADFVAPGIVAKLGGSGARSGRYAMIGVIVAFLISCSGGGPLAAATGGLGAIPAVIVGFLFVLFAAFLGGMLGELDDIPRDEPGRTDRAVKAGVAHMVGLGLSTVAKLGYGVLALILAGLQALVQYA